MIDNNVRLVVNGKEYGGWKEVEITAGIERQVRDFSLAVTRTWPGATDIPRKISPGDVCEVFIGEDKVLTGYVDGTPIQYDSKSVSVSVKGRSKTADLVDCSAIHKPGRWSGATVERIAKDLAAPYSIEVISEVEPGAPMKHAIEQGETVFESISRMLKLRQMLATDDAEGRLVFIKVGGSGNATTALKLGENILSGDASLDYKDVYSEYVCKGQRAGNDKDFGEAVAGVSATVTNPIVKRKRVLLIKATGQSDGASAKERVQYEMASRNAKALATRYTVQGWRQGDGNLWKHNQLVRVIDPVIGFDVEFVIAEVTYSLSDAGMICTLSVGPKEGYITPPEKDKKKKKGKGKGKGGEWGDVTPADSRAPRTSGASKKGGGWKDIK